MNLFGDVSIDAIRNYLQTLDNPEPFARELKHLAERYLEPPNTEDQFSEWWTIYPRRKGKAHAKTAFKRALKAIGWERLRAATEKYREYCQTADQRFIPYPATWLNGGRWDDEPDQAIPAGGRTEQQLESVAGWLRGSDDVSGERHTDTAAISERSRSLEPDPKQVRFGDVTEGGGSFR